MCSEKRTCAEASQKNGEIPRVVHISFGRRVTKTAHDRAWQMANTRVHRICSLIERKELANTIEIKKTNAYLAFEWIIDLRYKLTNTSVSKLIIFVNVIFIKKIGKRYEKINLIELYILLFTLFTLM